MSNSLPRSPSVNGRVLIVDDESFIREAIELYLATEGFDVSVAANGEEALSALGESEFDLAILDVVMPGMNGVEVLREMKKSYPNVEVIMASGNGTLQTAIETMRLGAYDYITKPILNFEEDLLKTVRKALERRRLLRTNRELAHDLREINRELKQVNSKLRRRVAELELACETGRMISEIDDVEALFDLAEGTLRYQLDISRSLLFVHEDEGWRLSRAPGFGDLPDDLPFLEHHQDLLDQTHSSKPLQLETASIKGLQRVLESVGHEEPCPEQLLLLSLRAGGGAHGLLFILDEECTKSRNRDTVAALEVFATQLAPPLALLLEKVAP